MDLSQIKKGLFSVKPTTEKKEEPATQKLTEKEKSLTLIMVSFKLVV